MNGRAKEAQWERGATLQELLRREPRGGWISQGAQHTFHFLTLKVKPYVKHIVTQVKGI
jgi:hypothetical protein